MPPLLVSLNDFLGLVPRIVRRVHVLELDRADAVEDDCRWLRPGREDFESFILHPSSANPSSRIADPRLTIRDQRFGDQG